MSYFKNTMYIEGSSGESVAPKLDSSTSAISTVDYAHHEIHGGSAFLVVYSALANDTALIEVRFATPDTTKWAHMTIIVESAIASTIQLWEGTTKTHNASNAIVPLNRNRNSSTASGLTVCHTPTGTESGTAALTEYVGAASVSGRVTAGGSANSRAEFVLKQNTAYLIRATSRADGNALAIILDWYEHTND